MLIFGPDINLPNISVRRINHYSDQGAATRSTLKFVLLSVAQGLDGSIKWC
jgi:hypothetical protein